MEILSPSAILPLAVTSSINADNNEFRWEDFFRMWFRKHGRPLFFLFKRNLGVTNTQYVELFSLLQTHCTYEAGDGASRQLLFTTTDQLKASLVDVFNALIDIRLEDREQHISEFCRIYGDVFAASVVVDMFYCSCAVFLPPGVNCDLKRICVDSGYIHSAGSSIFVRNLRKARRFDFEASVKSHTSQVDISHFPVPFIVYAHEDFDDSDHHARDEISRGIDGNKLFVEKMSMGGHRLSEIIQDMRFHYAGILDIPEAGPYTEKHRFSKDISIWLIGDRSVAPIALTNPGSERYYICYQQEVVNHNPLFLFDENKPAWKSHTTMPHSLTAALLNATRPHRPGTVICDPFCGTATTWFEAKRMDTGADVRCSDLSPIVTLMAEDNVAFFVLHQNALEDMRDKLGSIVRAVKAESNYLVDEMQGALLLEGGGVLETGIVPYQRATALLQELRMQQKAEESEFIFSDDFVAKLREVPFLTRLVFYIGLRAQLRFQGGYKRKSTTFERAFERSMGEIIAQTNKLIELRGQSDAMTPSPGEVYTVFHGDYSLAVSSKIFLQDGKQLFALASKEVLVGDARSLKPDTVDIILCDPPYGFNTKENSGKLAELYGEFIEKALLALRDGGHLILCLPAESYTGGELPYCTRSNLVLKQVLVKASNLNKRIFIPGNSLPHRMLNAPYYWEAERALRRVILHFRVAPAH